MWLLPGRSRHRRRDHMRRRPPSLSSQVTWELVTPAWEVEDWPPLPNTLWPFDSAVSANIATLSQHDLPSRRMLGQLPNMVKGIAVQHTGNGDAEYDYDAISA